MSRCDDVLEIWGRGLMLPGRQIVGERPPSTGVEGGVERLN